MPRRDVCLRSDQNDMGISAAQFRHEVIIQASRARLHGHGRWASQTVSLRLQNVYKHSLVYMVDALLAHGHDVVLQVQSAVQAPRAI